jgi:hypothetical protein
VRFRWDLQASVAVGRLEVTTAGRKSWLDIGLIMVTPDHRDRRAREWPGKRDPAAPDRNDNAPRRPGPIAERSSPCKVRYK